MEDHEKGVRQCLPGDRQCRRPGDRRWHRPEVSRIGFFEHSERSKNMIITFTTVLSCVELLFLSLNFFTIFAVFLQFLKKNTSLSAVLRLL